MDLGNITALILAVLILILMVVVLNRLFRRDKIESDINQFIATLPPGFTWSAGQDRIIVGPTGIWLVSEFETEPHPGILLAFTSRSTDLEQKIKQQLNLEIKIQSVMLLPADPNQKKFQFSVQNGVYLVGSKWLPNLLTENTGEKFSSDALEKIKSVLNPPKT